MISLGAPALPVLGSVLALPHMAAHDKTTVLYAMGISCKNPDVAIALGDCLTRSLHALGFTPPAAKAPAKDSGTIKKKR